MAIAEAPRAANAWRRIQDKPSSVAFKKPDGTTLAAQTMRVEYDNRASLAQSEAGAAPNRKLILFGIKGHATLADTDMEEGYRFVFDNDEYRITDVLPTIGERQATCEQNG